MSNAICTGLTSSGNSFSDAKSSTFSPLPMVICWIAVSPGVKMCAPLGPLPGSFVFASMNGGVSESSDLQIRCLRIRGAACDRPDALVAVGGHHVEDRHFALEHLVVGRQHVFLRELHLRRIHVARVAADERQERAVAEGGEAVGRPIAVEPVEVLVEHRLAQRREDTLSRRGRGAEQRRDRSPRRSGDCPSAFRWTPLIVSGDFAAAYSWRLGVNRSTKRDALCLRHFAHRLRVQLEPHVVLAAVRQIGIVEILVRDRREEHDARRRLAVVLLRQRVLIQSPSCCLNAASPACAGVRFVVAEEGEDHVRLGVGAGEAILLVAADRRRPCRSATRPACRSSSTAAAS